MADLSLSSFKPFKKFKSFKTFSESRDLIASL